jgi:hypothetical protein
MLFVLGASCTNGQGRTIRRSNVERPTQLQATQVNHVFWIWFENREITAVTTPTFVNFASTYANFTNFFGISHPSQPNYVDADSGSNQAITDDSYHTITANGNDNLAKQLAAAGKSWRAYMQSYPGGCSDIQNTTTATSDGPGAAGTYFRKHNHVISFESIRLDPIQCANIQPLANFDPSVNFAFISPNMINDMHDGTTAEGDAFLAAFLPSITGSADWAHTLVIITFDEGTTNNGGGGNIYTAAGAPWLSNKTVSATYNHFSMLRTVEQIFGLSFLGSAATATTINEILPLDTTAATVFISGRVLTSGGSGLRNARVTLLEPNGTTRSVVTNTFGYYRFDNVAAGGNYLLSAEFRGLRFAPRTLHVVDALTDVKMVAQ